MSRLEPREIGTGLLALLVLAAVACLPLMDDGYYLSLGVNIVMYAALCTAWSLFSGPTHYLSLAIFVHVHRFEHRSVSYLAILPHFLIVGIQVQIPSLP